MTPGQDSVVPSALVATSRRRTHRTPRGILGKGWTLVCWGGAIAALASSLAWTLSAYSWRVDLLANLGAQALALTLLALVIVALSGRWLAAGVLVLACLLHGFVLVRARPAIAPRPAVLVRTFKGEPARPAAADGAIRVLHFNGKGVVPEDDIDVMLRQTGADIVGILAPTVRQATRVIEGQGYEDRFQGKLTRQWQPTQHNTDTRLTAAFVVSRWPITKAHLSEHGDDADFLIAGTVEAPTAVGGPFGIIAVHPRSPRTAPRWTEGNRIVELTGRVARQMRDRGLPVMVLTDLNATPTGWRSRHLAHAAGLVRAKPLLELDGTYPNDIPLVWHGWYGGGGGQRNQAGRQIPVVDASWPLRIAIDDVLVSADWSIEGWSTLPRNASDHCPIVVDVRNNRTTEPDSTPNAPATMPPVEPAAQRSGG
jgi:endonuclease/exonuclease/phosphatase family metal-dependent hydrolase